MMAQNQTMIVFESTIFVQDKLGSWKKHYAILSNEANIMFYKNRDAINKKPQKIVDIICADVTFCSSSTINLIKFIIKTPKQIYKLASSHCSITDSWIKNIKSLKSLRNHIFSQWNTNPNNITLFKKSKNKWSNIRCTFTDKHFQWYNENNIFKSINLCDIKIINIKKGNILCVGLESRYTLELITSKETYRFYSPASPKWYEWSNTFKQSVKPSECIACNYKDNGYRSIQPLCEGNMTNSVLKNKKKNSSSFYYMIDGTISCLVGMNRSCLYKLKNLLIRYDFYESFVYTELKKNCSDFVDFSVDHNTDFIGPFMIIDEMVYECYEAQLNENGCNKWKVWIEMMQSHNGAMIDTEKDLCVAHLFLLIDGYCCLKLMHFPYDICMLVMKYI
eukprot:510530_1